ncbi:hypothetical protein KA005_30580 [bacterium]|nr:hypothetical protein [bacterium]
MGRSSRKWTLSTRKNVLLRCFFRCTYPGCLNLATDLHHGVLFSKGGSDHPENLIGLCRGCHQWVHKSPKNEKLALQWLADQIHNCPVRVDSVLRSALFEEVERAASSNIAMRYHTKSVYNSNSWNSYEVFLKAAWEFIKAQRRETGKTAVVLLYHFVNLYRRRPGIRYNRAASRFLSRLKKTYYALDNLTGVEWLEPKIFYHEGYLHFLAKPTDNHTYRLFNKSSALESNQGNKVGAAMSKAQSLVVKLRRGEDIWSILNRQQDDLCNTNSEDGMRWYNQNVPIHLACSSLMKKDFTTASELIKPMILDKDSRKTDQGSRPAKALYVMGIAAYFEHDSADNAIALVEKSRKAYWTSSIAEGRAGVIVTLGDLYWSAGDRAEAKRKYSEALRQPVHMDNDQSIQIAKKRLSQLSIGKEWRGELYHPWSIDTFT